MRRLALASLVLVATEAAGSPCAPERMVRLVVQAVDAGLPPESCAAQPRTIHRLGARRARLAEARCPTDDIESLIVLDEPDIWQVDVVSKTGVHAVDPGPSLVVLAPVFAGHEAGAEVADFELGCEVAFMREHGVEPRPVTVDGDALLRYSYRAGDLTLTLTTRADSDRPVAASLVKRSSPAAGMRYLSYEADLEPDPALFAKPPGIAYREAPTEAASEESVSAAEREMEELWRTYSRHPQPERVPDLVAFIGREDVAARPELRGSLLGILAGLFARHPDRANAWIESARDQPPANRELFRAAASLASALPEGARTLTLTPASNDTLWGLYGITGDTRYASLVLDRLAHLGERQDLQLYATAASAQWSLASLAREDEHVRALVVRARQSARGELATALDDVLSKPLGDMQAEMRDTVAAQHAAGVW